MFFNIKSQLPSDTKVFVNWMGWFKGADGRGHMANICQSDDPRTVHNQVVAAHAIGVNGFVIDWYGGGIADKAAPTDRATILLTRETLAFDMEFSIMIDKGAFSWAANGTARNKAFNDALQYIKVHYMPLSNYSKLNGKPIIWEFGWGEHGINIGAIAKANPDLLILTQSRGTTGAGGTYGWVNGFAPSSPIAYMQWYMAQKDTIQVPCIFDGFDDHNPIKPSDSIWGGNARSIPFGQWQMCLDQINKAAVAGKKFPAVQICTWNDYDERTQIESTALQIAGLRLF